MTSSAILIITGAWHVPVHYSRLTNALESKGHRVICECLPTNRDTVPPTATLADDIAFIKTIVAKEVQNGVQLTVIAHSYGGIISTFALDDYAIPPGSHDGGVSNIIFMAAFVPFENQSLAGIFGGSLPPYLSSTEKSTLVWTDPISRLYNDLSEEDATWAEGIRNEHHSYTAQHEALDGAKAAWRVIPSSYLICDSDQALPPFVQEMMIERVEKEGVLMKRFRCDGSHSAFISMPERVAEVILEGLQE